MAEYVNLRKLLFPAPVAVLLAAFANLIWYYIASSLFPASADAGKGAVNVYSTVFATIIYWVIGLILFAVLARISKRPITHFTILAIVALCISFIFPIGAAQGQLPNGATLDITMVIVLEVMHIIAAAVGLPLILNWVKK